jgi:hypothetical protein
MDVVTAQALTEAEYVPPQPVRDYSDRSGFPKGVEAARGAARRDFETPSDMRAAIPMPQKEQRPRVH